MPKVIEGFSFPDDATAEEINAFLRNQRREKARASQEREAPPEGTPAPKDISWGEYAKGLGRSAAAGLSFNFSDEALAGIRSLAGENYEEALADERRKLKAFQEQYPIAGMAGEVAGSLPTMLVPGLGVARGAAMAGKLGSSAIKEGAKLGAKQGALGGLGEAEGGLDVEGVIQRGKGAATGATTGAVVGGALSGLGEGAKGAYGAIKERFVPRTSDDVAKAKILQDLERSGMTPRQAQAEFEYLQSTGARPAYFDVNPSLGSRAEAVAQREGPAGERLVEDIYERQRGQRERIMGQARERFDQSKAFYETADEAADALRTKAKPFYEEAYKAKLPLETQYQLQSIMNDVAESFPQAIDSARRLYAAERRTGDFKRVGTRETAKGDEAFDMIPQIRQWDYIMRGLGDVATKETKEITGEITALGGAALRMRAEIANFIDEQVPAFARARRQYAGDLEVRDALNTARKEFLRVDPEDLARRWERMSVAEKEAYRAGALKNIRDSLFGTGDFTDATKRIGQSVQDRREALNIIIPEKASARLFQDYLEAEARIAARAQKVSAGSQTARRGELKKDLDSGADLSALGVAGDIANSRYGNAMQKVFNIITNSPVVPERRINAIGEMLRANKLDEVERLTASLEKFMEEQKKKQIRSRQIQEGVSAIGGREVGSAMGGKEGQPSGPPPVTIYGPGNRM